MCRRIIPLGIFFVITFSGWTQSFRNGVRTGMVKVKFSPTVTTTLAKLPVNGRSGNITTGITAFDQVVKSAAATKMYRLFPFDPKFEGKLRKHGLHLWYVIEMDEKLDPTTVISQFKTVSEVESAEVEREKVLAPYVVTPYSPTAGASATLPFNDPMLKDQWHYNNTGQSGYKDADINLFEAWTTTAGASNIIVSVHDQGVDINHSDLKANIWTNPAEANGVANVDDDGNGYVDDIHGYNFEKNIGAVEPQFHGTHVAGTIAAVNNNGIGVSGVAGGSGRGDGVKIMSLQILGGAPIERSYVYAANNGAVISQNSWGYTTPGYADQSVLDAIDYFIAEAGDYDGSPMKGGIVIFAAGNSNSEDVWYPGYHPNVFSVAAIGPEWKKAAYSNYGDWVEVSAPGGDQQYGSKSGVLSTIPKEQYAYLQGTSMACPHVSGIAALALANRTRQITSKELWNKLATGVVGIDTYNEEYTGKLGSGAMDASLAIRNDQGIAPNQITDLVVTGIAQEFATLSWSVPGDADDQQPLSFQLYYHTQPITASTMLAATKVVIRNDSLAGKNFSYEIDNLLGLTTYYFAVTATDRWGNVSVLSNLSSEKTNEGPSIAVDENSQTISMDVDAATVTTATHEMTILNEASGILRWDHIVRHRNTSLAFNASSLRYPVASNRKSTHDIKVSKRSVARLPQVKSNEPSAYSFTPVEKTYSSSPTNIVGETDTTITNSAAARFYVTEPGGFNLTQVQMYIKHDPAKGPVIVEVYRGESPTKNNLLYAQEYSNYSADEQMAYVTLDEQLYFEPGTTFWIAFHVPSGNLFPLGIGFENDPSYSANCFMSFNMGSTWANLEDVLNSKDFAWTMTAASYNENLGTYLTLEPGSGDIAGHQQMAATLTADAATLINGTYSANLILTSNDASHQQLRVPVTVNVAGHAPKIKHIDIADFGSVFVGTTKTFELVLENVGYGNLNNPDFSISSDQFVIDGYAPWQIGARETASVKIKFSPVVAGNINGVLTISSGDQQYEISLFGVGAETSKMSLTPETQVVDNLAIGDVVNAQVNIENTGAYPLKYFIPGHDAKGVSENWPSSYHRYGYKVRTNDASEANPVAYDFQNIASTGVNITEALKDDAAYFEVDMGFDFPFYAKAMQKLYVAQKGFTVFDNSVRPINTPQLNSSYSPKGYISVLGGFFDYVEQGSVFYQVEADRVIVQYDNVWDGYSVGESITAQMVLFANGDIRFYYDNMGFSTDNQKYLNILMENTDNEDGILLHNYSQSRDLYSGLAIGLDYPGPDIIAGVTNASGILAPGSSATVSIELTTASLAEGTTNRYVNFISNDPAHPQQAILIQLNVTSGGVAKPVVSMDTLAFGDVFQGAVTSGVFTIKNTGSANVNVTSIAFVNDAFTFIGEQPTVVKPGLYKKYEIQIPTATLASLEDWLTIDYADGTHDTIYVTGHVVVPPAINVDLSLVQETLAYGETSHHPLVIENPGEAPLEVVAIGNQWLSFEETTAPASGIPAYTYAYEKHNDGSFYQWIDIRRTGTQLPFAKDLGDKNDYWRKLTLPFEIQYYGKSYSEFKVGDNGIISFDGDPDAMWFPDHIPSNANEGTFLMPYWTFSGFSSLDYAKEDIGIFYQFDNDKIIITWSYFVNNFGGMGDPVSAQVIFYKDGTIKFQYKLEGSLDLTSQFTSIGLQENSHSGVSISDQRNIPHGKGLAFIVVPAKKLVVQPGATLSGNVNLSARNIYGGNYSGALKFTTNVPGSEYLEKPITLTVTGEAVWSAPDSVKFGRKMIAFENFSPLTNYQDVNITNTGSAPLEISWARLSDGMQGLSLQIFTLVDGWFGPEWRWADVSELYSEWAFQTPVFTVLPGDKLIARAAFAPQIAGDYSDELVLTTNLGEQHLQMIGSAYEPAAIAVDSTPIEVMMNTTDETAGRSVKFNNIDGKSDLQYDVSIDFGRVTNSRASSETVTSLINMNSSWSGVKTGVAASAKVFSAYNRILKYTSKETADAHAGTGGGEPLTVATRYNAGSKGFNLSHVETWLRTESVTEGKINVEIRAGGTSIANAVTLTEGNLNFVGSGDDSKGGWYQIAMNEVASIYPNEDFYVIVTLPMGIARPQGVVNDEPTTEGRYYYQEEGFWYNIQKVSGFETSGWLMFAAEETAGNSEWLSITSTVSGSIQAGDSAAVDLQVAGVYAKQGDQIANVVIRSNDPAHAVVKVPVKLHMNEAPQFVNAPVGVLVAERDTVTVTMRVEDKENNAVTVRMSQNYPGVSTDFSGGTLSISFTANYGEAGNYNYSFIATDQYQASREITIPVEVTHTNRAPKYIGVDAPFLGYKRNTFNEYVLTDFFSDDDGDALTFSAASADVSVASIFSSEGKFVIQAVKAGATEVTFYVKDDNGATVKKNLPVTVKPNAAPIVLHAVEDISTFVREGVVTLGIDNVFNDNDGDKMVYSVSSTDDKIAKVDLTGLVMTITPVRVGETTVTITATDPEGAMVSDDVKIVVNAILGDIDHVSLSECTVSPNPTEGRITVTIPNASVGQINVMNYLGAVIQVIQTNVNENTYQVDLRNEAAGIYLIEINDGHSATFNRIIKN